MTQPENDDVAVDEVLSTPATPGAQALPSTEDDGVDGDDASEQ
ncbi:hypothetical protein [Mycolicibacterium arenosum]|nr:hypothetical protein [Mycolicibacterium sp. CAU 1645]